MSLEDINRRIEQCRKCRLWKGAKNAVPGEGPSHAKIMLVGQNPGREEDRTGRPFVGRAGRFLNMILERCALKREQLFITSVVKHRTPENRAPWHDEIEACMPYLIEQINIIKPEIIVLMGTIAWQTPRDAGIRYIQTYHPAAAMRFPGIRTRFEDDFKRIKTL